MHFYLSWLNSGIATQILFIYGNNETYQYLSKFINIYICNACQYLYFCRKFAEMHKGKSCSDILNSTDHKLYKNIFNVKSCDFQQPIRYFKLFANCYMNIPLTDFWEKVSSAQKLQNEHKGSGTPAKVLTYVTHMKDSQKNLNSDLPVLKFVM